MFDRSRLQLARFYLELGNYADALPQIDSLSPSVRALAPVMSMRKQCLNLAVEQWQVRAQRACAVAERFPRYLVGRLFQSHCLRQFNQVSKRAENSLHGGPGTS